MCGGRRVVIYGLRREGYARAAALVGIATRRDARASVLAAGQPRSRLAGDAGLVPDAGAPWSWNAARAELSGRRGCGPLTPHFARAGMRWRWAADVRAGLCRALSAPAALGAVASAWCRRLPYVGVVRPFHAAGGVRAGRGDGQPHALGPPMSAATLRSFYPASDVEGAQGDQARPAPRRPKRLSRANHAGCAVARHQDAHRVHPRLPEVPSWASRATRSSARWLRAHHRACKCDEVIKASLLTICSCMRWLTSTASRCRARRARTRRRAARLTSTRQATCCSAALIMPRCTMIRSAQSRCLRNPLSRIARGVGHAPASSVEVSGARGARSGRLLRPARDPAASLEDMPLRFDRHRGRTAADAPGAGLGPVHRPLPRRQMGGAAWPGRMLIWPAGGSEFSSSLKDAF